MSRTDEEIKRFETKMKSCTTMTDLLVAMSSWQSYAQSHNLEPEQKRTVDYCCKTKFMVINLTDG